MIVYFVSYLTRINYSAVLVEIVNSRGISKTEASLAVTASALSYGIGQLVSGYFGDRIKPHRIVFAGLLCTAAMNFILPLFASTAATVAIWTVNGLADRQDTDCENRRRGLSESDGHGFVVGQLGRNDIRLSCVSAYHTFDGMESGVLLCIDRSTSYERRMDDPFPESERKA